VQTARLTTKRYCWGSGQYREEASDDLVYFFDASGKELGYWTKYNGAVMLISRHWDESIRRCHIFRTLTPWGDS